MYLVNSNIANDTFVYFCDGCVQRQLIGLARDLRGVAFAFNTKVSYMMLFDWMYPWQSLLIKFKLYDICMYHVFTYFVDRVFTVWGIWVAAMLSGLEICDYTLIFLAIIQIDTLCMKNV